MRSKTGILKSNTAVSETIGYMFILSIVIISVSVMMVVSYPILANLRDDAFMESSIVSLTMLDNRISMVAFGATPQQTSHFNLNGGKMTGKNDTDNRLIIQIKNGSDWEIIFDGSLGLVEYELGDQKIGYENGGLFRKYAGGDTVMISPPEFYYNNGTLTFPLLRINSNASIGGKGIININMSSNNRPGIKYPDMTSNPIPDFINPHQKNIKIVLKSGYYQAWAKYMEEQTEAIPTTNASTQVVEVDINPTYPIYLYVVEHNVNIDFH